MRLLFLGDSLIEYFDWQRRFPTHEVYNLGIAGETVEGLLSRIEEIVKKYPVPDMVFVMTGINNVAIGDLTFFENYRKILNQLQRAWHDTTIYIHSLLPVNIEFVDNSIIEQTNAKLKELAEMSRTGFINLYPLFTDRQGRPHPEYLLDDGVHLTDRGYEIWSREIEKLIIAKK